MSSVHSALRRLAAAKSVEQGDRLMNRLADTVRARLSEALSLYPNAGTHTFALLWSLQGIRDRRVTSLFLEAFTSRDAHIRWAAIQGLSHNSKPRFIPVFTAALRDRSGSVKSVAIQWLTKHGDLSVVPVLQRYLARLSLARHSSGHSSAIESFLQRVATPPEPPRTDRLESKGRPRTRSA